MKTIDFLNLKKRQEKPGEKNGKVFILFLIICACFCIYAFKLFSLQIIGGAEYRKQSITISSRFREILPRRGEIYDRNFSQPLVVNTDSFVVDMVPGQIPDGKYDAVAARLAQFLNIEKKIIDSRIPLNARKSFSAIEIKSNIPFSVVENIAENITDLPGVSWRSKPIRNYTGVPSLSHIIGYVGDITKEELKILYNEGYKPTSIVGKTGIERKYDSFLQGKSGLESRTVDVRGRLVAVAPEIEMPEPGKNLVLTIDTRIQALAEQALGDRVGAAIVLRPSNGEILAMVSYPYYDANIFSGENTAQAYDALAADPKTPLINRAINAVYPPASTFKVIMSAALLSEQAALKDQKIECRGTISYGNRTFKCHVGFPGHGYLDLRGGLAQSCNIYFWTIGRDYLGVDTISEYASMFGLGKNTGIDLPGSSEGFVPTALWKERRYHEKWLGGDTMSLSIGQGYTLVTPLHIADMMAMVVNGGTIYRPHLLKEIRDPVTDEVLSEPAPEVLISSDMPPQIWEQIQSNLRYTITDGTAQYPLRNKVVQIAGKTGTGEVAQYVNQWHSWFVSYAPFDAPPEEAVVVCVLVEAQNVWEWWAPYAANIIFQGIFANQTYDEALDALGFRYLTKPVGRRE